jgi:hypothetical protein
MMSVKVSAGEPDRHQPRQPVADRRGVRHAAQWSGQVAIDEVWSALRFRADKPGEEPFQGGAKK